MIKIKIQLTGLVILLSLFFSLTSFDIPDEKKFIGREVKNITILDSKGNNVQLFDNPTGKPVVLSPVYTRCPMACSLISNGLKTSIEKLGTLGKDFTVISFSFDSTDTKEDLQGFEARWKMDGVNWKTVTSNAAGIDALLKSIDYQYEYDEKSKEYLHPNLVVVITPSGRISRYIYGVEPKTIDLELAIMEAQVEKTSFNNFFKTLYIRCFTFNPATKSYHLDWKFISQTSAGMMFIIIVGYFLIKSLYSKNTEDSAEL